MAKRVVEELLDDIDGSKADLSMTFGMDGRQYTIDLAEANAERLRAAFAPYVAAARKTGRIAGHAQGPAAAGSARNDRERNRQIRDWALNHNIPVSDKGRLAHDVVVRFQEAGGR
ncbi:histone-like nucleoid-structuring protein Lsr2 [Dactylosporangium sp. CS-047395]|uniref:histone-like nucleoid-structuring protein Lsr2 n=1 Tax=Dactylosporangium sp. CS-047395 TaxID=3239936 RepID=UPI003D91ABE3